MASTRRATRPDLLINLRHLTPRDRLLIDWLGDHHVLTTNQIATALFPSIDAARKRLALLHRIGAVNRSTVRAGGGSRYTLGTLGVLLHTGKLPSRHQRQTDNETTDHLLAVNGFFTDLAGYSGLHPGAHLCRWWSATTTTTAYPQAGIDADGHGIWQNQGRTVAFFLYHDSDTLHDTLLTHLAAHLRLAVAGPRYPILLRLDNPDRETAIHRRLTEQPLPITVATSTGDNHPAAPVWSLTNSPHPRLALDELPGDPPPGTHHDLLTRTRFKPFTVSGSAATTPAWLPIARQSGRTDC